MNAQTVAEALLNRLTDAGITLRVEDGEVRWSGGRGAEIPPALRPEVTRRRGELRKLVAARGGVVGPVPRLAEAVERAPGIWVAPADVAVGGGPPRACSACRGRRFSRLGAGPWVCVTCHPAGAGIRGVETTEQEMSE